MKAGVSYFGNRMIEHFRDRDLPAIVDAGCTFVVHTLSEHDLEFYRATMQSFVACTHEAGLEAVLDPWALGGVFGGEAYSAFLLRHPESWQRRVDGAPVAAACLAAPAFRAFVEEWVDAAVEAGADAILWDEPHFHGSAGSAWTCRCPRCSRAYSRRFGEAMPRTHDLTPGVIQFRDDQVCSFLGTMCERARKKGLWNTVCVAPPEDFRGTVHNWAAIARIPEVDTVAVTPFWALWGHEVEAYVGTNARKLAEICRVERKEPQIWLQAFLIPAGREREIVRAAKVAVEAGVENLAAWGYRGCAHMSSLRCDDPDRAWDAIREAFTSARNRR